MECDEGELPWEITQDWIKDNVDVQTQKKKMTLDLNFGSYNIDFDRNGRFLEKIFEILFLKIKVYKYHQF